VIPYVIGYIHPFEDGNGRTARALFYWYVMSQHYDYLEYIAISTAIKNAPAKYSMAYLYSESDHDDITYFVRFNMRALNIAFDMFNKYIEKTKTENRKIIEALKHDRKLNFRQADVIIIMSKSSKHITIEEMQERYHITYQTARTDLLNLVELGYMTKILAGKQFLFAFNKEKYLETMGE
jgi:Fic family protein